MSLWEILAPSPEGEHMNITLLRCELVGVALGVRTRANAKTNIESWLGRVLDAGEATDLSAIADNFETGTVEDRLVYNSTVEMALNAAELGLINETQFRTLVSIS